MQYYLLYFGFLIGFAFLLLAFCYNKKKKLSQKIKQLNHKNSRLIELNQAVASTKNTENLKLNYVCRDIINDMDDSIGNKLASLRSSSYILEDLMESKKTGNKEFHYFLDAFNKYIHLLAIELKLLKWANSRHQNTIDKIIEQIQLLSSDIQSLSSIKINLFTTSIYKLKLQPFWNRQIVLICIQIIEFAKEYGDASEITINFATPTQTKLVITATFNGVVDESAMVNNKLKSRLNKRCQTIAGELTFSFVANKNIVKLSCNILNKS